ncbi:LysE family transporter [Frankia sp. CNm7]|uniref:LysE/ArgO family amino acid transporter n=1 Tax=Frankia nepalensis TaxID=1836974 RepID=UPI001D49E40E|nr:LysE family transporter [Frankia nepalensis]MBL7495436.1 LysE family transporter [Frankia nepalensis]MBL7510734.1 LysE family transporter [Frankia nepalensis]MBL7522675.1 LysE family transporter [Frankia nepalensis]
MLDSAVAGLLTAFSLIVAIGAQNAYVLRQGLAREWVGTVVAICAVSDLILIVAGVGGVGGLLTRSPTVLAAVRWFGVAFLLWFAVGSLRRARRPAALRAAEPAGDPTGEGERPGGLADDRLVGVPAAGSRVAPTRPAAPARHGRGRAAAAARAVAFTWLNPHVYLDTVLLLGTVATHEGPTGRWWFAVGAGLASTAWFTCLGYGARLASAILASPRTWQVIDLLIALTMLLVAFRLAAA